MSSRSISDIRYEIERYRTTINITLLTKNFIEKKFNDFDFFPPEENFYIFKQKEPITPDFSLLKKDKIYGIICEIKAGLPNTIEYLKTKVDDILKRYLNLRKGWDLSEANFKDLNYSLLFIVHFQNIENLKNYLIEKNKKKTFSRMVSVWEYSISETQYGNGYRFLRLRHYCGKSGINEIDLEANTGYRELVTDLDKEREMYLFTTKPPIEYTILVIWTYVFSFLAYKKKINEFTFTSSEVHKTIKENFMKWGGNKTLLKNKWIVNALKKMLEYNLIKSDGRKGFFKVLYRKGHKKNILEIIQEKIRISSEKSTKPKTKIKKSKKKTKQLSLDISIKEDEKTNEKDNQE